MANEVQVAAADGSGAMFDAIARRYDFLNRLLSFGLDRRWRRRAVAALELAPGSRVLDLATGTADLAIELARGVDRVRVEGVDPSPEMLEIGRAKVSRERLSKRIVLGLGDAQSLDYPDASFDAATIAFGIRNVIDRQRALSEIARVLRPGGRLAVLELNEPGSGWLALPARLYIHRVVPLLGSWVAGSPAYRYLERSIAAFPPAEVFAEQIRRAGLEVIRVESLSFAACSLFVAERPQR